MLEQMLINDELRLIIHKIIGQKIVVPKYYRTNKGLENRPENRVNLQGLHKNVSIARSSEVMRYVLDSHRVLSRYPFVVYKIEMYSTLQNSCAVVLQL